VLPRCPLRLPPGGAHWYAVHEIGRPDPGTFLPTFAAFSAWLDATAAAHDVTADRVVLAGFSQGAVMSYALGLAAERPRPAGIIALSGFVPEVPGFELGLEERAGLPVAIGHGTHDPVIGVEFGRRARALLEAAGADVRYRESIMAHSIDPEYLAELRGWLEDVLADR
jgi:phospholipase/carboxylesterase